MDYGKEYREKLGSSVRFIRASGLVKKPFRVRLVKKDVIGSAILGDYRDGVIQIQRGIPCYVAIGVLLHELAHHVSGHGHGPEWAEAYSKIYQFYIEGNPEQKVGL